MADDDVPVKRIIATPRAIRPRSTPNAEVNAQERDKVLRDLGKGFPLAPNQSYARGGPVLPRSGSLSHSNLFRRK